MHSDVFSVIADPTRRRIVRILAEQTHTVGAVVEKLGMSQPTISKHLKVLRDADVVSVTVEGQRRLYSLNPDVFATVTEWINETVQIARQSSEAHVPVALPGGVTASASDKATAEHAAEKPAEKTSEKSAPKPEVEEPAQKLAPAATAEKADETGSETFVVEAPTPEEIEQARIQRARAQYLTPSARIYSRPAEQAAESAASESTVEKTAAEPTSQEEAVDSTPMRPFTPASYGYDAGVTPAASATPAQPTTPAAPAEAKPVVAQKPVVFPQPAAAVSYGVDPAAVVGGSIQPIAVTPEAPAAEEPAVAEKTVNEQLAEKAEEKPPVEETVVAEKPAVEESATEKAAVEESDKAEGASEASSEEPEYQTMPAYDSVYRPSAETTSAEAKDNHRGGLFGFLRGRRR
ncbi:MULTISPECIES: metalloregulator ArsR/SmtB family transcription factor [Rothia]|jgi:predicted transcriptional regulator|uniref:Transcriptional regulator n=1 Tax=Rothia mucilaginosa TaxID=43675 RepID=A0A291DG26_9MICC|nr:MULTISPECIES: metalloregulator ArsR/SmtB family transcription factor [Rothia]ATF63446.1 transcriptional regulator [Rothia mucilaginosa]OFL51665.1 transcriptional regulator [Rothia sp. HMSC062H08]